MSPMKAFDEPVQATAVDGEVVLLGPGISGAFTPEAILESLDQLRQAAETALRNRDGSAQERRSA